MCVHVCREREREKQSRRESFKVFTISVSMLFTGLVCEPFISQYILTHTHTHIHTDAVNIQVCVYLCA